MHNLNQIYIATESGSSNVNEAIFFYNEPVESICFENVIMCLHFPHFWKEMMGGENCKIEFLS